jgi:L-ascorbate metabolism protein UlaG (beta-lactamase superfamily)
LDLHFLGGIGRGRKDKGKSMARIISLIFLLPVLILGAKVGFGSVSAEWPLINAPTLRKSDHFDGQCFFNKEPDHTFGDMLKWLWEMERVDWPKWIEDPPHPKPRLLVKEGKLRVTYVNHGTILIQMDGLNILTDPIWSRYAGPFSWFSPKRVRAPGVKFEDLPQIDIILISHDHYDHLDLPTLKKLVERDRPKVITGLGVRRHLKPELFEKVYEMDWWQEYIHKPSNLKIIFVPALHQSGRSPFQNNRTLWGGFVIEGKAGRVFFAGDTGFGAFLNDIKRRFPSFRLTIFPIGSYEKRWFMKNQHLNPDDAVRAHLLLDSEQSLGMHFATFREHPEQAIDAHEKDLAKVLKRNGLSPERFWILKFGEGRNVNSNRFQITP